MSFQTPITIASAIKNIEENRYLLPSIQREFEWKHEKIEWLFDSIMRSYPISSFLFWRVEGETKRNFKFYKFIKNYRQKYNTHNEEFSNPQNDFTAILDGQQRLTSLYIGLRGSYAYRVPRLKEENSERVYPTRHLYLNISKPLVNEEDGRIYEFKFLTENDLKTSSNNWFRVSEIYNLSDDFEFNKYLDSNNLKDNEFSYRTLSTLKNVIHSKDLINFFLETEQNIDKALNIFIRINSGGEPLNFSDLIMSIAVANWEEKDARKEIHALVDSVRDKGFSITKDFILKTFLYLHSKDIKFKVVNFSKDNAKAFEEHWDKIRDSILSVFDLIKTFGFNDSTLTSKNALIPIIYYLYHRNIENDFHSKINFKEDREIIKKWLHVSTLKRIFGGQSDNTLAQIRNAFLGEEKGKKSFEIKMSPEISVFPESKINDQIRRDTSVGEEFVEELLKTQKDDRYAFSILALLYPHLDYKNNDFHKDHLHPISKFYDSELIESLNIPDEDFEYFSSYEWINSIINLQMLNSNENQSKQDRSLDSWLEAEKSSNPNMNIHSRYLIPKNCSLEFSEFKNFCIEREKLLTEKILELIK